MAGIEPAIVALTGRRRTVGLHRITRAPARNRIATGVLEATADLSKS